MHVRWAWWFVVPASAWLMYTVDRLLDVRKQHGDYNTPRHRFHRAHQRTLWTVVAILAPITLIIAVTSLLPDVWLVGAVLGGLAIVHEATQRPGLQAARGIVKDLTVVCVYTAAVWSVPILRTPSLTSARWCILAAFLTLALQNVLLFGCMEEGSDASLHRTSLVRSLGRHRAVQLLHACAVVVALLSVGVIADGAPHMASAGIIIVVMTMILEGTWAARRTTMREERYRLLGDGIFIVPALLLVLPV